MIHPFVLQYGRCPDCRSGGFNLVEDELHCRHCAARFPVVVGRPVLIRHDNELFPISHYQQPPNAAKKRQSFFRRLAQYIPNPSLNLSFQTGLPALARGIAPFEPAYVLVIGAGQQKKQLETLLAGYPNIQFVSMDIDSDAWVDLFCDAHELPFVDQVFHGIIVTAVLEHVMYPERVAAEMYRVLVNGALIYSEVPFMQQVHEGAYDFTRFSLSGHRRLLNQFEEIKSGLIAGPGTVLVWTIENFVLCFVPARFKMLGKAGVRLTCFWFKYIDYLLRHNPQAMDGASATYFIGRKNPAVQTSDKSIIERYVGAKQLDHL